MLCPAMGAPSRREQPFCSESGLKRSMKKLQGLSDTAGMLEKPGRPPHIPLFPRRQSSFARIGSTMQHRAPGAGPPASRAVLL